MSRILVTGGAGYIGSHACLSLMDAGHEVVVYDNLSTGVAEGVPAGVHAFVQADVGDSDALETAIRSHDCDRILHFAGSIIVPESVERPIDYYRNNTVNTLSLAETAVRAGVKALIFSSTAAVYAPTDGPGGLSEAAPKAPLSPYGASKLMSEQMLFDIGQAHGLKVGVLRYFNVAGADPGGRAGQRSKNATHLIKVACEHATGKRDALPVFGTDYPTADGTCVRDYIHVSDLADAHGLALAHLMAGGDSFVANCGYGRGASVLEVVATLEALIGRKLNVVVQDRRAGDAPELVADSRHLRALTPWTPRFMDLDKIVGAALAWERQL